MKTIAIYNEKSGVGKTFLTLALAKFLKENYTVVIGDTIQGQRGLTPKRKEELEKLELSPAQMKTLVEIQDISTPNHIEAISNLNKYDFLILDTGGTSQNTFDLLFECDMVILVCDTYGEDDEMKLDLKVYDAFKEITFEEEIKLKEIHILFNKVNENYELNTLLLNGYTYLETNILFSKIFSTMKNTLHPLPSALNGSIGVSLLNTLMQLQNVITQSSTTKSA